MVVHKIHSHSVSSNTWSSEEGIPVSTSDYLKGDLCVPLLVEYPTDLTWRNYGRRLNTSFDHFQISLMSHPIGMSLPSGWGNPSSLSSLAVVKELYEFMNSASD